MANSTATIDDIMGFDAQNLNAFQEKGPKSDPNIYKTNPKDAKSEDGIYRSRIKILLNPIDPRNSIVSQATYWLNRMDGSRLVRSSLSEGDKSCALFRAWKRLWFSGDENKKEFSKKIYDKNESNWVLVQILEDENKPELVGQFRVMKLAKDIYDKLNSRMNPSASGKSSYPVMDYVIGLALDLEVQPGPDDPAHPERKQREISYSLSNFGDYATVIKTDGTPLLSEDEVELVDTYVTAINDSQNGKTDKKRKEGLAKLAEVKPQIRPIYEKVITYVKENLNDVVTGEPIDLQKYCGFTPWDEETRRIVNEFTEMTDAMVDPATMTYEQFKAAQAAAQNGVAPATETAPATEAPAAPLQAKQPETVGDLPF
jgi:hypothetical protein